ncbi:plasmid partition protein ParG [Citrobacter amalonaticus]|uniref:plasmid partition protein ParG n=1 Tax=Citrobacter amalonaticus TaxID=35703 RepID=UPI00300C5676
MNKENEKEVIKTVRIQVYTTEEKHRAFKMVCAGEGRKMTDVVDDLITSYLKEKGITIE